LTWCWRLFNACSPSTEMIMFLNLLLMNFIICFDFYALKYPYILWISLIWLWCVWFFQHTIEFGWLVFCWGF
jgi:hypothetical protein